MQCVKNSQLIWFLYLIYPLQAVENDLMRHKIVLFKTSYNVIRFYKLQLLLQTAVVLWFDEAIKVYSIPAFESILYLQNSKFPFPFYSE